MKEEETGKERRRRQERKEGGDRKGKKEETGNSCTRLSQNFKLVVHSIEKFIAKV
jgi:hypothetical protein